MNRFLLDEHLPKWWLRAIIQYQPILEIHAIGDGYAPTKSTGDPDILVWCQEKDFYLLTNDRTTMPGHLADHISRGHTVPGIFLVRLEADIEELSELLYLLAGGSFPDEFLNQVIYLSTFK